MLISLDTLRADRLGVYGYERPTSPRLEELAADGVLFEEFIQNGGGTLPSHMTMMTSLHPATHGIGPRNGAQLPAARQTLAERLHAAGHHTAAFTDAGWVLAKFGFAQGFDIFDEAAGHFEKILPKAEAFLERNADRPFFLFLHTYDIHSQEGGQPYSCPGDFADRYLGEAADFDGCRDGRCATALLQWANGEMADDGRPWQDLFTPAEVAAMSARYDGCVHYADAQVGRVVDRLKDLGLYDRTLIVVTSDHGEEFLEHGRFMHTQGGYEVLAHVPLILKLPGSWLAGHRVTHLAAMVDLLPTLLEVLGIGGADDGEVQGRSLLPAMRDDRPIRQATHLYNVLRTERWKFFGQKTEQLFDLQRDPGEQQDLIGSANDGDRLRQQLTVLVDRDKELRRELLAKAPEEEPPVELSESEIRELQALGYLD